MNCMFFLKIAIEFHFSLPEILNSLQKKRKPGKSPEKECKNGEEVASASRNSSIASKTGPKKAKFKKSGNNSTGAYILHM